MYFQPEYGNPDGSPGVYRPEGYVLKKARTPDPSEMVRGDNPTDKIARFQALLDRLQLSQ